MKNVIAIASLLITLLGCAGSETGGKSAPLGEPFTLRVGESIRVGENVRLRLEGVEDDSRCPEGAVCAWEGNARVRLEYQSPDHPPVGLVLNTSGRFTRDTTIQRYRIALSALDPRPKEGARIEARDYAAKIVVSDK